MATKRDCIEDLTNFRGDIHELKQVVDYIYDQYGWDAKIHVENEDDQINFIVQVDTMH